MKRQIGLFGLCVILFLSGCNYTENNVQEKATKENKDSITLMHVNADKAGVQKYVEDAEKKLNININLTSPPANAYNRQAKISTLLSSGDSSVDIITVNDEMISEFKHKGYLETLDSAVMPKDIIQCYPSDYMEKIVMKDSKVYSVPMHLISWYFGSMKMLQRKLELIRYQIWRTSKNC